MDLEGRTIWIVDAHRDDGKRFIVSSEQVRSIGANCNGLRMTITEIRPFRNGWQVYESVVMQPVFLGQEQAIDYAKGRACFGSGEIRVLN